MSMKKILYSIELELKIIKHYQKGESLKTLAQKYHVNESNIQKWKVAYAEHGIKRMTTKYGTYSGTFEV